MYCIVFCFLNALICVYAAAGPPDMLWPLDSNTYGNEVILSPSKPVSPVYCGMSFNGVKPPGYLFDAVYLDGSSYIDVPVSNIMISGTDFSFTGMFQVSNSNGTFFHFQSNDETHTFKGIKLWFSGDTIFMSRNLSTGEETGTFYHLLPASWFQISFGIDFSNGKMKVHIDRVRVLDLDTLFADHIGISLPGKLRIGATLDSIQPNLVGHVTCVGFDGDNHTPDDVLIDNMCKAPTWSSNKPNCHSSAMEKSRNTTTGMFVKQEAIYSNILNLLSTSQRSSEISCAMGCHLDKWCWYYKLHIKNGQPVCLMYTSEISYLTGMVADDEDIYQWHE